MLEALYDVDIHQYNRHCLCLTAACIVQAVCIDFLPQKQLTDTRCTFDKIMFGSALIRFLNIIFMFLLTVHIAPTSQACHFFL